MLTVKVVERIVRIEVIVHAVVVVDARDLIALEKVEREDGRKQVEHEKDERIQHEMQREAAPHQLDLEDK